MTIAQPGSSVERREPLTRERVVAAAVGLADREGLPAVSMRKLGQELGVEAMSLYTHVRGKDDLLDGMADAVVGRIPIGRPTGHWRTALRRTILAARSTMLEHPWAAAVIETRAEPGPATIRYMDTIAAMMLRGGFSPDLAHHSLHVLGSRILGFSQDLYDDKTQPASDTAAIASQLAAAYPSVAAIAFAASHDGGLGGCDDDVEFAFGLDLILDGLERRLGGGTW
ncbi:MAG TPA: TetR/AcrR family transcriptional regulator C-terminal domain-containing protein [Candidatus Limnocylindrales bacterium]